MGTLELKLSLIQRLSLINDDDLLHRIKSLIDRMEEGKPFASRRK